MGIKLTNNANATLAAGINSSATSITLTSGQGARFPTLTASDYFYATLIDTSNNLEIVKCTARSTDVLTVVRAQESTTARAYSTGDRIEIRLTAQTFIDATTITSLEPSKISDQSNTSTGAFDLPSGTTAQRPASPLLGDTRYNTDINAVESYHGSTKGWIALSNIFTAAGGTEYVSGGYRYHKFTSSSNLVVQSGSTTVEALIVAGGGGGYEDHGGGGAGGLVYGTLTATAGTYTVTVGGGGSANSSNGSNSVFASLTTAAGGGRGSHLDGASGGSGCRCSGW